MIRWRERGWQLKSPNNKDIRDNYYKSQEQWVGGHERWWWRTGQSCMLESVGLAGIAQWSRDQVYAIDFKHKAWNGNLYNYTLLELWTTQSPWFWWKLLWFDYSMKNGQGTGPRGLHIETSKTKTSLKFEKVGEACSLTKGSRRGEWSETFSCQT